MFKLLKASVYEHLPASLHATSSWLRYILDALYGPLEARGGGSIVLV